MKRILDSFWFNLILGFAVLLILILVMFDAVAIGVLGRPILFDLPK